MFLHHTMTDSEILRTCDGCESPHLRLVAERLRARVDDLRARVDDLRVIGTLAAGAAQAFDIDDIRDALETIRDTAKPK
jgi:hypothetical protein